MLSNHQGMSLIEIMVGLAIMALVSLGVMRISDLTGIQAKSVRVHAEVANLTSQINSVIAFKNSCLGSLSTPNGPQAPLQMPLPNNNAYFPVAPVLGGGTVRVAQDLSLGFLLPPIGNQAGNTLLRSGQDYDRYGLKVTRLVGNNSWVTADTNPQTGETEYVYIGNLLVGYDSLVPGILGGDAFLKNIGPLTIRFRSTGEVISCFGTVGGVTRPEACGLAGGAYQAGGNCVLKMPQLDCAMGHVMTGIFNNIPKCDPIGAYQPCPAGTVLVGMDLQSATCQAGNI